MSRRRTAGVRERVVAPTVIALQPITAPIDHFSSVSVWLSPGRTTVRGYVRSVLWPFAYPCCAHSRHVPYDVRRTSQLRLQHL